MATGRLSGKLAVTLHANVAGSTVSILQDKELAHEHILDSFLRFSNTIEMYLYGTFENVSAIHHG